MITTNSTGAVIVGNLDGEIRVMGVRHDALAQITDSLANLYSDRYRAVLREYSTNARDSHIQAGKAHVPIEVSLPDEFDQQLIIRDQGVGLSKDEVLDFYAQYGASDKRSSNEFNGTYGYGCKSAFTLGNQFVVTAVKDGWETVAVLYRNEDGVGIAQIVAHQETDKPSGVEVKVPIDDPKQMAETAAAFFLPWEKGTVLIDGQEPQSYHDHALQLGDIRFLSRAVAKERSLPEHGDVNVVMGGVVYPVTGGKLQWHSGLNFLYSFTHLGTLYVHAPIGAVDIVPSREGLKDTEKTILFLRGQVQRLQDDLVEHVQELVRNASSLYEAAKIKREWDPLVNRSVNRKKVEFTWHAQPVHSVLSLSLPVAYEYRKPSPRHYNPKLIRTNTITIAVGDEPKILALVNMDDETKPIRGLRDYMAEHGYVATLPLRTRTFARDWFNLTNKQVTVKDYGVWLEEQSAKRKALRGVKPPVKREEPRYVVVQPNNNYSEMRTVSEIKGLGVDLYYADGYKSISPVRSLLDAVQLSKVAVLVLEPRQLADTVRNRFPGIKPLPELAERGAQEWIRKVTPAQVRSLGLARAIEAADYCDQHLADILLPVVDRIEDPELVRAVRLLTGSKSDRLRGLERLEALYGEGLVRSSESWLKFWARVEDEQQRQQLDIGSRFPLLGAMPSYNINKDLAEHVVLYVNSVYNRSEANDKIEEVA